MPIREFEQKKPKIAATAFIDPMALVIGDVTIGECSSLWPMVVVRGDVHRILIGHHTNIQDGTIIHVAHASEYQKKGFSTKVGNYITVGHQVVLHGCTIEDECLIGIGARVLDGAVVEHHTMVGAGSLVPPGKILESGYLWLGVPVRKARQLTEAEMAFFKYSAEHYCELKERYELSLK
jgi:carbonic anhydrase/acetyltransferase-like protein (isoleucine patch superfamily)